MLCGWCATEEMRSAEAVGRRFVGGGRHQRRARSSQVASLLRRVHLHHKDLIALCMLPVGLGRLWALRRSALSREVRVRSLHICDVHPSASLDRAFRRRSADSDRTLSGVQILHLRKAEQRPGRFFDGGVPQRPVRYHQMRSLQRGPHLHPHIWLPSACCNFCLPLKAQALLWIKMHL